MTYLYSRKEWMKKWYAYPDNEPLDNLLSDLLAKKKECKHEWVLFSDCFAHCEKCGEIKGKPTSPKPIKNALDIVTEMFEAMGYKMVDVTPKRKKRVSR